MNHTSQSTFVCFLIFLYNTYVICHNHVINQIAKELELKAIFMTPNFILSNTFHWNTVCVFYLLKMEVHAFTKATAIPE